MLAWDPMRNGPGDALDAEPIAERRERADDIIVERHVGERPTVLRCEIEMGQAHGVAHLPIHDRHRQDRLRFWLNRRPGADMFEQAPRPVGDRDRTQRACARRGRRSRIDDGDGCPLPHRLLDRGCKRQSGRAAAGDDDVEDGSGFGQCGRLLPARCRTDDESIPALGPPRHFQVRCRRGVRGGRRWTLRQTSLHAGMISLPRIFVDKNIRV